MPTTLTDMQNGQWLKAMTCLAALAMFLPVGMQFIGEEPVFAIFSCEMLAHGNIWQPTLYGLPHQRPPLYTWLVNIITSGVGCAHVDIAIRLVSIAASLGTAAIAGFMAQRLISTPYAGWLAALVYLTLGETMFWYGWLGYADATFAFFIFAMSAGLWLAIRNGQMGWYALAVLMLICAVLTKAMTAYVFFVLTALVCAYEFRNWRFLLRPLPVMLFAASLLTPWLWGHISGGAASHTSGLVHDITQKFTHFDVVAYLRHIVGFPLHNATRVMPLGLLVLWLAFRRRLPPVRTRPVRTILLIIGVNYLPYWLAPESSMRYVIIFYGWVTLAFTFWLVSARQHVQHTAMLIMVGTLVLKVPYSLWLLPHFKQEGPHRDQRAVAADILRIAGDKPIRTLNHAAEGIGVAAYIDMATSEKRFVLSPKPGDRDVFIMTYGPRPSYGAPVKTYKLHNTPIYLYHLR